MGQRGEAKTDGRKIKPGKIKTTRLLSMLVKMLDYKKKPAMIRALQRCLPPKGSGGGSVTGSAS